METMLSYSTDANTVAVSHNGAVVRHRSYSSSIFEPDYFIRRHLEAFIEHALDAYVGHGTRVLDVGCGEQPLRARIEAAGARYTGLDIGQNALNTVQLIGGVTALPVGDDAYDVIVCTEVLEHVFDTFTAFCELTRILKP